MAGASTALTRPAVTHQFLAGLEGVRHLPADGPFVLVANHSSFADHLVLDAVLDALRDTRTSYLTKAEAFVHPVRSRWTHGMGGIPVDRDRPGKELLAAVDGVFADRGALVVYPEGTRGPGWPLLPFKDGAFRFAVRAGVPVVPVAMWGAQHVLPKGASLPRNARVRVVFGAPLPDDTALPRPQRVKALVAAARDVLELLVDTARTEPGPRRRRQAALELVRRAEAVTETMLSHTDRLSPERRVKQARLLITLARRTDPATLARADDPVGADARVLAARLTGLRALKAPAPLRPALLRSVRRGAEEVLAEHPDHLMARYLLGRWYLLMPRVLGGDRRQALEHLRHAARLGAHDTRYAMAYAEALIAVGHHGEAAGPLRDVLDAPAPDPRTADRRRRAEAHYQQLAGAGAGPTTPRG
ncbi:lysophospholipid acyltransferase family protein [Streptomyces apricus]|uniref:1-acyl-sn-glycerol-3-phosphate acyltransferase n=1 Tax=Streptomyces apricus TaxID=1828112 RepID=A0A5B0AIG8_9ACTN|nr:lysophospholipid acyltransferase family protein [Streptomyces apricus]KAA0929698.1 1-acyl-sn-glycerol-3-phosphate acyltransferase [Streptomyces apricus]